MVIEDRWAGTLAHELQTDVGDFALRRADGAYAYQLAVVIDDERMGVTEVVREAKTCCRAPPGSGR